MKKKFYTLKEAATLFNYSERRFRQFCQGGDLPAIRLHDGGKWLIPVDAVEEFLNCKRPRRFGEPIIDGYIVTDTISLEFYNWLTANGYKLVPPLLTPPLLVTPLHA